MDTMTGAIQVDETEQKRQFAAALLKTPNDAFKAAITVFGDDTSTALSIYLRWSQDPEVIGYMRELEEEMGELHFLPTKAQLARMAYEIGQDSKLHVEDRLKALRLYADVRGFIEKQAPVINNNLITNNKVMLVKDHGSNEAWEQAAMSQQHRLIEHASAPRAN